MSGDRCALCETPMAAGAERCPACGLWRGEHHLALPHRTMMKVGLAFAGLYSAALVVVALAR